MRPEELFAEMYEHLCRDRKPSVYLDSQYWNPLFRQYPFEMLYRMKKTEQSPKFHPEGDVWVHSLMVVDEAAKMRSASKEPAVLMWAALLHDVGKPEVTRRKNRRITSQNHDVAGERLAREFLESFVEDQGFVDKVCYLVRYHMYILLVNQHIPVTDLEEMKRRVDLEEMALLGLSDRLGRGKSRREAEERNVREFLQVCRQV